MSEVKELKSYHFLVLYSLSQITGAKIKITAVTAGAVPCHWHFLKLPVPGLIPVAPASASY